MLKFQVRGSGPSVQEGQKKVHDPDMVIDPLLASLCSAKPGASTTPDQESRVAKGRSFRTLDRALEVGGVWHEGCIPGGIGGWGRLWLGVVRLSPLPWWP